MVLDAVVEGLGESECTERILRCQPEAVIFLKCQFSQEQDFSFMKKLKDLLPDTRFIASGGFLLVHGDKVLQEHPYVDAISKDFTSPDIISYIRGEYKSVRERRDG